MVNNIQLFQFQGQDVRVVWDDDKQDWRHVASDACKILDHSDVSMACARLDDDEKGTSIVCTPGGPQRMLTITESGLYHLIFTSRKDEAKAFRKWVTSEVLPAIRKTGSYSMHGQNFNNLIELDPCNVKDNKKLLRRIVMLYEDVILGLQEKLGLYKRLEKHYHPEQAITRGKREVTAINVFATDEKMKHLVFKIVEEEVVVQTTFIFEEDEESA